MTNQEVGLQDALAAHIRRCRQAEGWSHEDLAGRAVLFGLPWKRATVADLEARRRDLKVEELLLLPAILGQGDLLAFLDAHAGKSVRLGGGRVATSALREIAAAHFGDVPMGQISALEDSVLGGPAPARLLEVAKVIHDTARDPDVSAWPKHHAAWGSRREAEVYAARSLKVDPLDVLEASYRLWGHGLTEERNGRAEALPGGGHEARRRARVSRQLIQDLRAALEKGGK
ncbi:MAG: hypothetical protein H0V50_01660 [Thermoleophilaceae bacterium]|nr:hypothetical protein [Thermoleophilaceae bacterium]